MTEDQTSIERSYQRAMNIRDSTMARDDIKAFYKLEAEYNRAYMKAYHGGDKFQFHRATRRYLKALRALSQQKR